MCKTWILCLFIAFAFCFWGSIPANQNAQLSKRFWITTSSAVLDRHTAEGCNFTVPENCILKWLEWSTWQLVTERNFLQTINGTVHQPAQSHEVFRHVPSSPFSRRASLSLVVKWCRTCHTTRTWNMCGLAWLQGILHATQKAPSSNIGNINLSWFGMTHSSEDQRCA